MNLQMRNLTITKNIKYKNMKDYTDHIDNKFVWKSYETQWNKFVNKIKQKQELWNDGQKFFIKSTDIPWPPKFESFLHYWKDLCKQQDPKSECDDKVLWTRAKFLALKRYHPDKIDQNFMNLVQDSDDEKAKIMDLAKQITQTVTILYNQVS